MSLPKDLSIIDPHIHQWDILNTPHMLTLPKKLLGWNKGLYEAVLRVGAKKADRDYVGKVDYVAHDYLPSDYAQDSLNLSISHVVHVEAKWLAKDPLGVVDETRWVDKIFSPELNNTGVELGGIVGFCDFRVAGASAVIDAHQAASSRLVGLRQMLAWDNDKGIMRYCDRPGIYRDPSWQKNFSILEEKDLSFDAWFFHHQLDEMVELAKTFPNVRFVLCHMGTPIGLGGPYASYGHTKKDRDQILAQWKNGMAKVAQCPNVTVKLSGFFMPVVGWGYHLRDEQPSHQEVLDNFKPLVDFVISLFGVERCMFASNFPMDKVSMSLETLYSVYSAIVEDYSDSDRVRLFRENAADFYRITTASHSNMNRGTSQPLEVASP